MDPYVLDFQEIDKTKLMIIGGKGANLGELSRIEGIQVPAGFCVTTAAYKRIIGQAPDVDALLDQLARLKVDDTELISKISAQIRSSIEGISITEDIKEEIMRHLTRLGEKNAYAVRSSATAEDLPNASFAGQQDTYLNVKGIDAILHYVSKCWASLFTERAVIYRLQNGFDHRKVFLAVVVQRMVFPQTAGILFTADPVTSNRKVLSIDASFGLGEALVSGLVNADIYKVRDGNIIDKKIAVKKLAIYALESSGTEEKEIEPARQIQAALSDVQILQLERMGRKIEEWFSCPQDIEWCLYENTFFIVQSRPITTLFPIPENDGQNRIYTSIGHQQMMTDAIRPLGLSFFKLLSDTAPLYQAGGRLFYDLTYDLTSFIGREIILRTWGKGDPLMYNAIRNLMKRKAFMKSLPRGKRYLRLGAETLSWGVFYQAIKIYFTNDVTIIQSLISKHHASIKELQKKIAVSAGDELFSLIIDDHKQLKEIMYDARGIGAIMVGLYAANWINKKMEKWLREKNAADTLSQSVSDNVTSEMGLALLDVSDVVRQYPAVIEYFHHAKDEDFFEELSKAEGGEKVSSVLRAYLEKYGMRCTGEIDITRPRWWEKPTALIPMIISNINNFAPDAGKLKFAQGQQEAKRKELDLLTRLTELPGGQKKAKKAKKMISLLRNFIGFREYPKYTFIHRYWIYKQALLKEADRLVKQGLIREREDIYYISFSELREAVKTNRLNYSIITKLKADYEVYEKLTPPRVMTSEGEIISGEYDSGNIPANALPGIPVSAGIIEGRARVILKMDDATLETGDILVTSFTDPSWTPVFVSIKGLVTEVGGLMTHGAVIAREYGLPAVVSVENATKLIKDGQQIRVNGTDGYVEIL